MQVSPPVLAFGSFFIVEVQLFLVIFKFFENNSYICRRKAKKNNSLEIISPVKYGSHWYHTSSHLCLCVPRSIGLGAESTGMGIRVSPRGLLHQFRLPFLALSGNCPLVRYDNDMRMRRKEKPL